MMPFAKVFTSWSDATDPAKIAVDAVRNGYAVIPVQPGGKVPMCTLTARELKVAGVRHACGVHHAITDPQVARRVFARLGKVGVLNIGIVAHPSRIVVVDVDTPEAVESFLSRWAQAEEDERYLTHSPTVRTPGTADQRHHDGGHYYFALPDGVDLPVSPGQLVLPGGGDVRWGMVMTVAPPSRRPEGRYETLGEIRAIPAWLLHAVRERCEHRAHATGQLAERYTNDAVVRWSIDTPWAELLARHGWHDTNKLDRCDCPVWEKPAGGTSSDKSATAHEAGCDVMPNREGHGALHLWTTDPPEELRQWCDEHGTQTLTKLQFVAAMEHDGDETSAKLELGLETDYGALWDVASGHLAETAETPTHTVPPEEVPAPPEGPEMASDQGEQVHPLSALSERVSKTSGAPLRDAKQEVGRELLRQEARDAVTQYRSGTADQDGATWIPKPDLLELIDTPLGDDLPGVLTRIDGPTLFPRGRLHQLFGKSEAGKSWLMLMAMLQLALAGKRSLYCDFEDTARTFIARFREGLGVDIRPWVEAGLICYSNPTEPPTDITALHGFDLVVVDSLSEVVSSVQDGSLKDGALIRRVMRKFRELADEGASVVIIAHASEKLDVPTTALGASEIRQALTGQDVLLVNERHFSTREAGRSRIYIAKDRTAAAGGDSDVSMHGPMAMRRLWGEMFVTPAPPDELTGVGWHSVIEIHPATHVTDEDQPKKIDLAEKAVIAYLLDQEGETGRVADMADELTDEETRFSEKTVRRAVVNLIKARMVHVLEETSTGGRPSRVIKLGPAPEEEET